MMTPNLKLRLATSIYQLTQATDGTLNFMREIAKHSRSSSHFSCPRGDNLDTSHFLPLNLYLVPGGTDQHTRFRLLSLGDKCGVVPL